ncbi:MAG TPA: hypothetical protein V6C99_09260 [Oculatellaceae cyanobacterium]|jgi:hypothetical protein
MTFTVGYGVAPVYSNLLPVAPASQRRPVAAPPTIEDCFLSGEQRVESVEFGKSAPRVAFLYDSETSKGVGKEIASYLVRSGEAAGFDLEKKNRAISMFMSAR